MHYFYLHLSICIYMLYAYIYIAYMHTASKCNSSYNMQYSGFAWFYSFKCHFDTFRTCILHHWHFYVLTQRIESAIILLWHCTCNISGINAESMYRRSPIECHSSLRDHRRDASSDTWNRTVIDIRANKHKSIWACHCNKFPLNHSWFLRLPCWSSRL